MHPFGYLRVSGQGQVDGDGPERQKEAIQKWCKAFGMGEPAFFYEKATSGTVAALDRQEFLRMLERVDVLREITPDAEVCVIVERQDRLARDLIVQELLLAECAKNNIKVFSADQHKLQDIASADLEPTQKLFRQLMGMLAEWNKSVIVRRLRSARDRQRIEKGRCEGAKPYGELSGEKANLKILATYRHAGLSFGEIAAKAAQMGLKNRRGKPFTRGGICLLLKEHPTKPARAPTEPASPDSTSAPLTGDC